MNQKLKKIIGEGTSKTSLVGLLVGVLILPSLYNACADAGGFLVGKVSMMSSQANTITPSGSTVSPGAYVPRAALTYDQVLQSSLSLAGVPLDSNISSVFTASSPALLATSDISQINSPMWIAATSVIGQVCASLITKEMASTAANPRNFFVNPSTGVNIDLTVKANAVAPADFVTAMNNFALHAWGRALSSAETTSLESAQTSFISAESSQVAASSTAQSLMLFGCTAMLASLESISL